MALLGTRGNSSAFGLGLTAAAPEVLGGMVLMTPTSVDKTGTGSTATIGTNGSVEFSSCATLSLNGVFNTDYDNYMMAWQGVGSTGSNSTSLRLRASGTDATGSNYIDQYIFASSTSVSGSRSAAITSTTYFIQDTSLRVGCLWSVYGPFLTQPTALRSVAVDTRSATANLVDIAAIHSVSSSYDGVTFIASTGTITGTVSVYGLVGT